MDQEMTTGQHFYAYRSYGDRAGTGEATMNTEEAAKRFVEACGARGRCLHKDDVRGGNVRIAESD